MYSRLAEEAACKHDVLKKAGFLEELNETACSGWDIGAEISY